MTALLNDDSIEVIVPVARDDLWGNELLEATTQQFQAAGKMVTDAVRYPAGTTDFQAVADDLVAMVTETLQSHLPGKTGVYIRT